MMDEAKKKELLKLYKVKLAYVEARDSLEKFMHVMWPDEEAPDDFSISGYQPVAHARLLCELIEAVERGDKKRVAVSIPPQHGKTKHLSIFGPAWIWGRNPRAKIIVATYNEIRAAELGEEFRREIQTERYRSVFPAVELSTGSQSKTAMGNTMGGKISFVGTGGTVTGRTADYFIIDDPMKDDEELQNDNFREKMWKWFYSVAFSRGSKRTRIIVLHTRWHADDLIGRLCDPSHPDRHKRFNGIADDWLYLNISGVVEDPKLAAALGLELKRHNEIDHPKVFRAFGDKPIAALWEADKDLEFFAQWKLGEPRTFSALVMGQPTIEDGEFFQADWLEEYDREDLPKDLRKYGASDHAVSEKQERDPNVLGCVGIDSDDNIWVLPDLVWERMQTDRVVEELLVQFRLHRPLLWWMENELISKSFGPFLKKRMIETRTYVTIDPVTPAKDKRVRARAIQGRMSMKKVKFPRFAPWWPQARSELLQFPYGAHDDFVDWLAHIGQGLLKEIGAPKVSEMSDNVIRVGSVEWTLRAARRRAQQEQRKRANEGW
ncbi:phage terminase large subunit [Rhodoligotrophos defluvii]|uniref:phage terminase large subunit n=1 Tax=Rhodoligotrophos defluvii TaxID=2561934 RepID=UPI0010C95346|nr:phage terminase large subunit [Rhodoligotrophos defluvii]